jgi:hypothetical protein
MLNALPDTTINMNITYFSDSNCKNMKSNPYMSAPNPLVFNDVDCSPGPVDNRNQFFVRARSCGTGFSFAVEPQTCDPVSSFTYPNGMCQPSPDPTKISTEFIIIQCSGPRIIAQILFYSNTECSILNVSSSTAANPILVTSDACTPLTYQGGNLYLRAASCGTDVVVDTFTEATCGQTSLLVSQTRRNNSCERNGRPPGTSVKFVCRFETGPPAPPSRPSLPPADAASRAASGATSPGVIAGSVIGAVL